MRLLTTYICFFVSISISAQVGNDSLSTHTCEHVSHLLEDQKIEEAYRSILELNEPCPKIEHVATQALVFAAHGDYVLAHFLMRQVEAATNADDYSIQLLRIEELMVLDEKQFPAEFANTAWSGPENDLVVFAKDSVTEIADDRNNWKSKFPYREQSAGWYQLKGETHEKWAKKAERLHVLGLGSSAYYLDSLVLLTVWSERPFSKFGSVGEIICMDKSGKRVKTLGIASDTIQNIHPAVKGHEIIISSNRPGGIGGMDLWRAQISESGYSNWENLGREYNTPGDEVFPSWVGDTLFFSSNRIDRGYGGLDIYAKRESGSQLMAYPLNTAYDDFGLLKKDSTRFYLISNRPGTKGGDDIFEMTITRPEQYFNQVVGRIETGGQDMSGVKIEIFKPDGSFVASTTVDEAGYFKVKHLMGDSEYELKVQSDSIPEHTRLKLYSDDGALLKDVPVHTTGVVVFELLSPSDYTLDKMDKDDDSVLSIDIAGLYAPEESEAEGGLQIYLEDSNGQLIGVSSTSEDGRFIFDAIRPDVRYTIRSEVSDPNAEIHILDKNGNIIETISPERSKNYVYIRLSDEMQVITMTNELNESVSVSQGEIFDLPVIHFDLDRAELTNESRTSLNKVADLLKKNPGVEIEVMGHTDSRGPSNYNLELSQQRIDAVIAYLEKVGIDGRRMRGEGFGEKHLLNKCSDGVECTEEEHAVNRRTEMKVFKKSEL